jgi:hypothetical protein
MGRDPAEAERFYGNNPVAGAGVAFDAEVVKSRKVVRPLPPARVPITIGVDGALMDDALALVATEVATGFTWPLAIIERPENASDDYEHDKELADGAMVEAIRALERLAGLHRRSVDRHAGGEVARTAGARSAWSWCGDESAAEHGVGGPRTRAGDRWWIVVLQRRQAPGGRTSTNAQKAEVNVLDDKERPMHILAKDSKDSPRKKDGADAAVLAWKARSDAIELGVVKLDGRPETPAEPEPKPRHWTGGVPPVGEMTHSGEALPAGFMG